MTNKTVVDDSRFESVKWIKSWEKLKVFTPAQLDKFNAKLDLLKEREKTPSGSRIVESVEIVKVEKADKPINGPWIYYVDFYFKLSDSSQLSLGGFFV